jgi:hypothetical protein
MRPFGPCDCRYGPDAPALPYVDLPATAGNRYTSGSQVLYCPCHEGASDSESSLGPARCDVRPVVRRRVDLGAVATGRSLFAMRRCTLAPGFVWLQATLRMTHGRACVPPPAWYFRMPAGRGEIRVTTADLTALEAQVSVQLGVFGGLPGGREWQPSSDLTPLALPGVPTFVNPSDPWQPTVPVDWISPAPFTAGQVTVTGVTVKGVDGAFCVRLWLQAASGGRFLR